VSALAQAARRILQEGALCYLAVASPLGPHITPVVFAFHAGRVWGTTARRTVKVRAWKRDPRSAGLVRSGSRALSFRGTVTTYDVLDPSTWGAAVRGGPAAARASVKFTLKNAPFFAGYAVDARRVPLSWTPPGRVLFSVDLEDGAVIDLEGPEVLERWGRWGARVASLRSFRASRGGLPEWGVPQKVREAVGAAGEGVVGLTGPRGLAVLPARWTRSGGDGAYFAALDRRLLSLTGGPTGRRAGLVADRASRWRAADMAGVLVRGPADAYVLGRLQSGRGSLLERIGGPLPGDPAVLRVRPDVVVWWKGWASGTVGRRDQGRHSVGGVSP
jgi:hypothetical protein